MQSPRFSQQTGRASTLTSFRPPDYRSPSFCKLVFANQGNQESRLRIYCAKITTRRITFRMECVGKTCCAATYRVPPPVDFTLEFRFLELAKGFEPLTL